MFHLHTKEYWQQWETLCELQQISDSSKTLWLDYFGKISKAPTPM